MRSGHIFLTWILLASTVTCLRPADRKIYELKPRGGSRQGVSTTLDASASLSTDTMAPTTTNAIRSTSGVVPASSDTTTTDRTSTSAPASTTIPASTSRTPGSPTGGAAQATSVPLLFTESSASTSPTPVMFTATPTPVSDTSVPFFDSKYHQMIIALASLAGALLIAMIVLAVIAIRARADVDLLHDRLSRYEEGFDLPARKGEAGAGAGYGRLSMSDPDEMKSVRSKRTTSESSTLPLRHERRLSGTPMGSGTPPGKRRVAFGSEGNSPTGAESALSLPQILSGANKSDASLFQRQAGDRRSSSSLGLSTQAPPPIQVAFPTSQPAVPANRVLRQSSGPRPNPGSRRVSLVDNGVVVPQGSPSQQVRRLPIPASNSSQDSRSDPFVGGPPN